MASPPKMGILSAISEAQSGVLTFFGFWTGIATNRLGEPHIGLKTGYTRKTVRSEASFGLLLAGLPQKHAATDKREDANETCAHNTQPVFRARSFASNMDCQNVMNDVSICQCGEKYRKAAH
jgi:hypothetical protein